MKIDFLFAEKIDNRTIKIYVDVNGKTQEFEVNEFLLLNDINKKILKSPDESLKIATKQG